MDVKCAKIAEYRVFDHEMQGNFDINKRTLVYTKVNKYMFTCIHNYLKLCIHPSESLFLNSKHYTLTISEKVPT